MSAMINANGTPIESLTHLKRAKNTQMTKDDSEKRAP